MKVHSQTCARQKQSSNLGVGDSAISDFKTPCRKAKLPQVICSSDRFRALTFISAILHCRTENRPRLATNFAMMIPNVPCPRNVHGDNGFGMQRRTANGEAHSKHPCAARRLIKMALLRPVPVLHHAVAQLRQPQDDEAAGTSRI